MPYFTYVGDAGRTYVSLPAPANGPEPGQDYKLAEDPGDGRWLPAKKNAPANEPPAPAGDTNKE